METVITAVVVVAIALPVVAVLVAVAIFDRLRRGRLRDPAAASLTVTSISNPTQGDAVPNLGDLVPAHEDFVVEGTVERAGFAPYPITIRDTGWTNRWPRPGQTVPILVDARDPQRARIDWAQLG